MLDSTIKSLIQAEAKKLASKKIKQYKDAEKRKKQRKTLSLKIGHKALSIISRMKIQKNPEDIIEEALKQYGDQACQKK